MKSTRPGWSALVLLFLAAGVWLSRADEPEAPLDPAVAGLVAAGAPPRAREPIAFPRDRGPRARRPPRERPETPEERAPPPSVDPLMRALPAAPDASAFVVEWNAIRHSPLAEAVLACRAQADTARIDAIRDQLGVDVRDDIDRVAFTDGSLALSGYFEDLVVPPELGAPTAYGEHGRIFALPGDTGFAARVNDDLLLFADTRAELEAAIDRVEGRSPARAFDATDITQNDIFGTMSAPFFQSLLEEVQEPRLQQVLAALSQSTLRVHVDDTLRLSLDVEAQEAEKGEDLARMIGGLLAGARREAEAAGEAGVARLLEEARVLPGPAGSFGVDLALPGEVLLDALGCPPPAGGDPGDPGVR